MPNNWKTYKLGDLIKIKHGFAFKGKYFTTDSGESLLLTPGNFEPSGGIKFNWSKQKFYTGYYPDDYILSKGDLIIALTDLTQACDILGAPAVVKDNHYKYLHNQRLGLVDEDKELIDRTFLYHYFNTHLYRRMVQNSKTGSTVSHTAPERIYKCDISLPPLPEQRAIASILSTIDDQIENNLAMNKTLEEMAMALYKHWFVDFGPFQEGNFVESELGEIPEGWEVSNLENHLEIKYGKDHKKLEEGNIPVYGTGGIMRYVNKSLYEKDSILIPRKGSLGNVYYISEPFWSVDTLFYSIIKNSAFSKFLYYKVKNMDLASMDVGSAIPSLTTALLKKLRILVPPENQVVKFESKITEYFKIINHNLKENQTLIEQRDALLPKLVSGEVRVKGFE